jgi:aarF domain-containing kinase
MLDMASQIEEKMEPVAQGDILVSVLDVLRRLPRRVVMVMKLNDLAR